MRQLVLLGTLALAGSLVACSSGQAGGPGQSGDRGEVQAQARATAAWRDEFDTLDASRWVKSAWPVFWGRNGLSGTWQARNSYTDGQGHLVLRLDIRRCGQGFCAQGAELSTRQAYGFGRYTFRMRMATTSADPRQAGEVVPGSISAAFNYANRSDPEIDVELDSHRPNGFWAGYYRTEAFHNNAFIDAQDQSRAFHTYTFEWRPGSVTFFLDGEEVWQEAVNVPQNPAPVFLNLWPTNEPDWGGFATPGTVYMLVDSVSFEPF